MLRVRFSKLEDMAEELMEKGVEEVRLESLHDRSWSKEGVPFMRVYVNVGALLPDGLPCEYQEVVFNSHIAVNGDEKLKEARANQDKAHERIETVLAGRFTVRKGHFEER